MAWVGSFRSWLTLLPVDFEAGLSPDFPGCILPNWCIFFLKKNQGWTPIYLDFHANHQASNTWGMWYSWWMMAGWWLSVYGDRFRGYNDDRRRYINMKNCFVAWRFSSILWLWGHFMGIQFFRQNGIYINILPGQRHGDSMKCFRLFLYQRHGDCPIGFMAFETEKTAFICTWAKTIQTITILHTSQFSLTHIRDGTCQSPCQSFSYPAW